MTAPSHINQAMDLLRLSNDGEDLPPEDISLIQQVVNSGLDALTKEGQEYWNNLHQSMVDGTYIRPWLHNQENLLKDHEGYVTWKGIKIEHYSFRDWEKEATSAKELASICREIENRGQKVSWESCSKMYQETYFGEGMTTPRFHVFWHFDKDDASLKVVPETSTSVVQSKQNYKTLSEKLHSKWQCEVSSIRHVQVNCKEDLSTCFNSLREDSQWAKSVLYKTHVDDLIEQLYKQIDGTTLTDATTLSNYVLKVAKNELIQETIAELNDCFKLIKTFEDQPEIEKQALIYSAFLSDVESGRIKSTQPEVPSMIFIIKDFCQLIKAETETLPTPL